MAYKLKSAFRPSERKRREIGEVEINLTPIMNLVVVLIPLLLQAIVLIELGRIDYEPPPLSATEQGQGESEGGPSEGPQEPTKLNLLVNISDTAIQVSIFGEVAGDNYWVIGLTEQNTHDFVQLQEVLYQIKNDMVEPTFLKTEKVVVDSTTGVTIDKKIYRLEDADIIRIAASANLDYQSLVTLLDITRSIVVYDVEHWLFPQPVLGQLQQVAVVQ